MAGVNIDVNELDLDGEGRVVLNDATLSELALRYDLSSAGGNVRNRGCTGGANTSCWNTGCQGNGNVGCTNSGGCDETSNWSCTQN